jgi:dephospho-CoA kinase
MKQTILAISGKPGLYKLVSRATNSLIVEALDDTHKRMPAFGTDRITSLADIAMYTDEEEVPLRQVLKSIQTKENGGKASLNPKTASKEELTGYLAEVLPNYDRDRVYPTDVKKLLQWYNILVENGITDFDEALQETQGDNVADRKGED